MREIKRQDLEYVVANALFVEGRKVGSILRKADKRVIEEASRVVLDAVFRNHAVLIAPSERRIQVFSPVGLGNYRTKPGEWGPDDPLPEGLTSSHDTR